MSSPPLWCFSPFCLDPVNGCLWRDAELLSLRPKPFAVLAYLVAHAGQVVHKETLLEEVWPEAVVSDGVLKDYINNQIRETLGDTAHTPQYITTVHRRGYRFVASVTRLEAPPAAEVSPLAQLRPPLPPLEPSLPLPSPSPLLVAREAELAQLQQFAASWLVQLPALWTVTEPTTLPWHGQEASRERMLRELAEAVEVLTADQRQQRQARGTGFDAGDIGLEQISFPCTACSQDTGCPPEPALA